MSDAASYLRKREWSMGNGQCPECCGVPPSWHGHPLHLTSDSIGHLAGCTLADALRTIGETPLMLGEMKSDAVYETYWTDAGFLSTRIKAKD